MKGSVSHKEGYWYDSPIYEQLLRQIMELLNKFSDLTIYSPYQKIQRI